MGTNRITEIHEDITMRKNSRFGRHPKKVTIATSIRAIHRKLTIPKYIGNILYFL